MRDLRDELAKALRIPGVVCTLEAADAVLSYLATKGLTEQAIEDIAAGKAVVVWSPMLSAYPCAPPRDGLGERPISGSVGEEDPEPCPICHGVGWVEQNPNEMGLVGSCKTCHGTGKKKPDHA